jgi:hypothetical protein
MCSGFTACRLQEMLPLLLATFVMEFSYTLESGQTGTPPFQCPIRTVRIDVDYIYVVLEFRKAITLCIGAWGSD